MNIKEDLLEISNKIALFIKGWLEEKENFACRTFYGETFTLAFLEMSGYLDIINKEKLLNSYVNMDKNDSQFHWEFNNYSLLQYYLVSKDEEILKLIYPLKYKNTPCTNWTLLRSNSKLIAGYNEVEAIKEAKLKIKNFQLESGLILDERKVKSFQYHCFSMAMIAEIYDLTDDRDFYNSFILGVKFIRNFILSTGDTIYIGRGQRQSFGYGALIYILTLGYKYTQDATIIGDLIKVINYLKKFQQTDGSFPLVMNNINQEIPQIVDIKETKYAGWYPYNNYFDYLPFLGFFIKKAYNILDSLVIDKPVFNKPKDYIDNNYIKKVTTQYEAIVARTGGFWTNDMPMPYVISKGENITPCYGGEQFQKSIYSIRGLPLPFSSLLNKSIRWKGISLFINNNLWIISPLGVMKRKFEFYEYKITIQTKVYSIFNFINIYLFNEGLLMINNDSIKTHNVLIKCRGFLDSGEYEYSADGKLKVIKDNNKISTIEFIFPK